MTSVTAPVRELETGEDEPTGAPTSGRRSVRSCPVTRREARWRHALLVAFVAIVDAVIVLDAFAIAYLLRFKFQVGTFYSPPEPPAEYFKAMLVVTYSWLFLFKIHGLYDFSRIRSRIDTVHLIARATSIGVLIILSIGFFYRDFTFSRLVCLWVWGGSLVLFCSFRLAIHGVRRDLFREGIGARRVAVVGSRRLARFLCDRLDERPELGYRIVGTIDGPGGAEDPPHPRLGGPDELEQIIASHAIDRVFIAHPALEREEQLSIIATCDRLGVELGMVPPTYDLVVNHHDFEEVDGIPLVSVREYEHRPFYSAIKRGLDITLATAAIVVSAPLGLWIAWRIRSRDGGPALFSQWRVGREGRPFRMWKFRTMVVDAEARLAELVDIDRLEQPVFKLDSDPRVTPVGRWLRRTSLDELPQLWNVLRGDMSLVGPRPEESRIVERYGLAERRRLKVEPGITGLQQIQCRGTRDLRERVSWDILYVRKRSLLLDVWILLRTVAVVLSGRGAR